MSTTQTTTARTKEGWTVTLTDKTMNSIRKCRRCSNVRTFVYVRATNTGLYRADGAIVVSYQDDTMFGGSLIPVALRCPKCAGFEKVATVSKTRVTKHVCNGKCMASTSGVCECSCGGKNHGMAHTSAVA